MPQPNIVYVHSHDTGRYVQPYGHAIDTPNIQRLADEGVLFRKAFTSNPTCSPSRACLLTGQYAHQNGMIGLVHRGARLRAPRRHLARRLREGGYATALGAVQHVTPYEGIEETGYERRLAEEGGFDDAADGEAANARRAAAFIHERARADDGRPFFLDIGFFATHRTGGGRDAAHVQWHNGDDSPLGDPRHAPVPAPLPDTPAVREDLADFRAAATRLDTYVGTVLDALEEAGVAEETLVVCTTDHGIAFPFMKCNLLDHGTGVMLVVRGPGGFTGGRTIDALVDQLDLYPTICELAGLAPPADLEGESLTPLVRGTRDALRDELFATVNYHGCYEPKRAVRTQQYKYIRLFDPKPHPPLPNCDDSPSKRELLAHGWGERPQEAEYLFDLAFDPNEGGNVAADPAYGEVLAEMRGRLERRMRATRDPLLEGAVQPWEGMVVNRPDAPSPRGAELIPA